MFYLKQIATIYSIIQSGVPVYLYPLINTLFKAAFVDSFDINDDLLKLTLDATLFTWDEWNVNHFNGVWHYYPEPDVTHGSKSVYITPTFNGRWLFSGEDTVNKYPVNRHSDILIDGNLLNGEITYTFKPGIDHNAQIDWISTAKANQEITDTFEDIDDSDLVVVVNNV